MVIKINKLHFFVLSIIAILISFVFAMKSEKPNISTSGALTIKLPIVMYHHITDNKEKSGNYTVTADEFENDLKYIKDNGYTPITVNDLINFVYDGVPLEKNPIMLTFDDGFESFYVLAYPLLKKYNFKAVLSVIGYTSDKYSLIDDHNINYSNLNWSEIKEMSDSGLVEIQNHTYDLHENKANNRKGMLRLKNETAEEYENIIATDLLKLQHLIRTKTGKESKAIAYPFGAYTKLTSMIIRKLGFKCSLTCEERINTVKYGDIDSLYELGRYNRKSGITSEDFFGKIIKDG